MSLWSRLAPGRASDWSPRFAPVVGKHNTMCQVETQQREAMVTEQIVRRGVRDPRVLAAMRRVARHRFLPASSAAIAYEDRPAPIGFGQTISQPYIVAFMTELLALQPSDRVLEIGTGSGYQTAILAELAKEVVTIERHEELSARADAVLADLGYDNITLHMGDGSLGWPQFAPYDAILVTAGCPNVPAPLPEQLAVGGRLVCPAGSRTMQHMYRIVRSAQGLERTESIRCIFVPLVGAAGWAGESP